MKKQPFIFLLLSIISVMLLSCSADEKIIDTYTESNTYLFADSNKMNKYSFIEETFAPLNLNFEIKGKITVIKYFRGNYYIIVPQEHAIYVMKEKSYEFVAKIDFLPTTTISNICFPNATEAYVCYSDMAIVSVVDLTTFTVSKMQASLSSACADIAGMGNQIWTCGMTYSTSHEQSTLMLLDTRDILNDTVKTVYVEPNPRYITFTDNGAAVYSVSIGKGKEDETEEKTPAYVTVFNVFSDKPYELKSTIKIGSESVYPTGIAASKKDAYIISKSNIWRISLATAKTAVIIANNKPCKFVAYNSRRNEVYFLETTGSSNINKLLVYDAATNENISIAKDIKSNVDAIISE